MWNALVGNIILYGDYKNKPSYISKLISIFILFIILLYNIKNIIGTKQTTTDKPEEERGIRRVSIKTITAINELELEELHKRYSSKYVNM